MKKSEFYRSAQIAVINSRNLPVETKIEVLRILFEDEDIAIFQEKRDETKEGEQTNEPI